MSRDDRTEALGWVSLLTGLGCIAFAVTTYFGAEAFL